MGVVSYSPNDLKPQANPALQIPSRSLDTRCCLRNVQRVFGSTECRERAIKCFVRISDNHDPIDKGTRWLYANVYCLGALNGKSHFWNEFFRDNPVRRWFCFEGNSAPRPSQPRDFREVDVEQALFREIRRLVDAWLATGINQQGTETPQDRSLSSTSAVEARLEEVVRETLYDLKPVLSPGDRSAVLELDLYLNDFGESDDKFDRAQREARRLFTALMLSDNRLKIAKCRRCGLYYFIARPRNVYKRGTFCRKCKSADCALTRTALTRKKKLQTILAVATRAYNNWHALGERSRKKYRDVQDYVAEQLKSFPVTRSWVTRHLKEIVRRSNGQCE